MRDRALHAVIFDLDGVIANTVEHYYHAGKRLADEINIPYDRELNQKVQGLNRYKQVEIMLGDKFKDYSEEQIRELGDRRSLYYREKITTFSSKDVLPGMVDLLIELKEKQIKTALASASSNAFEVVEKLGVRKYLDIIVDIKKIKNGKPDPEIFLTAANLLNVEPINCVAIEDGEAGLTGILQTDMFSIGVGKHEAMRKADWRVMSTDEITLNRLLHEWENKPSDKLLTTK
ncbi:beta-phosphoglucomutase [Anaerobacillus alkalilacustris]|uniref:Beta-phosphoglucomutase n=1 Tax=Anaerobacillus alkalilacustris TaxID=393763 RepID=A0A1S2LHG0_9BACI|nr:beta-phosphoglucomutase [Anaerobacillus alkalilacustris]OIJ11816.1 beta-phosphoglucomutase [Anaerobacillus alkalilacustris]